MRSWLPVVALAGSCMASACLARDEAPVAPRRALAPDMRALIAEFASDSASVRDFYTIEHSAARLLREDGLDAAWLARLDALDFDALDTAGRIDWLLLRNELRHADDQRAAARARLAETAPLLPFAGGIAALEEARWHLAPVDPQAAATELDALARAIKAVKERVDKGKPAPAGEAHAAPP
ncbi:MAG TPA: hypothetical protein VK824_07910, partial [Planctomycetota bacterium]|nr:hypothetical protein [Planctomycetota bacterium]